MYITQAIAFKNLISFFCGVGGLQLWFNSYLQTTVCEHIVHDVQCAVMINFHVYVVLIKVPVTRRRYMKLNMSS